MRRRELILGLAAATAAPFADAPPQPAERVRRVALLMSTLETEPHEQAAVAAFRQSLEKAGWTVGRDVEIVHRWGAGDPEQMAANAREIVGGAPDVITVKGGNLPAVAKLTTTIPIVFVFLSDAAALHYVASLARPRGNITGFTSGERDLVGKRLQLLREMAPAITQVLYLRGVVGAEPEDLFARLASDARASGFAVTDGPAREVAEIEPLIADFADRPNGGLVVAFNAFTTTHAAAIVALAAKYRLPAIYPLRFFADQGGLMAYGFDQEDQFRKADRILKGARPTDLPVQEPTKFELVIELQTAKALGLTVPQAMLARADEVIE